MHADIWYVYFDAMRTVSEFPKGLKIFPKEVGVPEAIIDNSHKCNKSKEVKLFCHRIGTNLSILEGSTQLANKVELYAGLFKEAVRKDVLD